MVIELRVWWCLPGSAGCGIRLAGRLSAPGPRGSLALEGAPCGRRARA